MGEQKVKKATQEEKLKEAEDQLKKQKSAKIKSEIKTDDKKKKKTKKTKVSTKKKKAKKRSKKYQKAVDGFDRLKKYDVQEAVKLAKETNYSKFKGSLELHVKLEKKKNQQPVRTMIDLPHGTGKKINIIVLDQAKIDEIAKTKKINFDIALATPEIMPKVGKIAKILGPKGKMPNPKSGTVTNDTKKTIEELSSGKIEIKEEKHGLIHQLVGKLDWDDKKLVENIDKILSILPKTQIKNIVICPTMGPGIKIKI